MKNKLEVIAEEFGFDVPLKSLFFSIVELSRQQQMLAYYKGYTQQQISEIYYTPYELAEQIYSKREKIRRATKPELSVRISISR